MQKTQLQPPKLELLKHAQPHPSREVGTEKVAKLSGGITVAVTGTPQVTNTKDGNFPFTKPVDERNSGHMNATPCTQETVVETHQATICQEIAIKLWVGLGLILQSLASPSSDRI